MPQYPIQIALPVPFTLGSVNTYLFTEPEPTLVDCGMNSEQNRTALIAGLAEHNLTIADLKRIVITHAHVDHIGMASWLCEQSDAQVWVSEHVYPWAVDLPAMWQARIDFLTAQIEKIGVAEETVNAMMRYMRGVPSLWGSVPADRVTQFASDGQIELGGATWDVLYLPGHSVHQTGFYQAEAQWLFSADCILHRTPVPVIERNPLSQNERIIGFPRHLKSLEQLAALDLQWVFPGHGDPIADHRSVIQKQLNRIQSRKEETASHIAQGLQTLPQLTEKMYGHYPPAARFTGLSTILGYIDLLTAENRVSRHEQNGIWHFEVV